MVQWSPASVERMWVNHGVMPDEADEAVSDVGAIRLHPDPASRSGKTDRVVGWSHSRTEVLCVIVLPGDIEWGVNAWPANPTYRRLYKEANSDDYS